MVQNQDGYPKAWYIFHDTINSFLQSGQPTINLDPSVTISPNLGPKVMTHFPYFLISTNLHFLGCTIYLDALAI